MKKGDVVPFLCYYLADTYLQIFPSPRGQRVSIGVVRSNITVKPDRFPFGVGYRYRQYR